MVNQEDLTKLISANHTLASANARLAEICCNAQETIERLSNGGSAIQQSYESLQQTAQHQAKLLAEANVRASQQEATIQGLLTANATTRDRLSQSSAQRLIRLAQNVYDNPMSTVRGELISAINDLVSD